MATTAVTDEMLKTKDILMNTMLQRKVTEEMRGDHNKIALIGMKLRLLIVTTATTTTTATVETRVTATAETRATTTAEIIVTIIAETTATTTAIATAKAKIVIPTRKTKNQQAKQFAIE